MKIYKSTGNRGLFDEQENHRKLSAIGNPLEMVQNVIDFEMFRDTLEDGVLTKDKKSPAGAKPYDVVMMFKILILQRYYGLGDTQLEYQIIDRLSFKKFLGLESGDKVPDEKTVWAFREKLTNEGLVEKLFSQFNAHLKSQGLIMNEGKMIDASFTIAPRQRNTKEENKKIKEGVGNELWEDKPNKKKHKDIDARWTKKNGETFYGYKNHAKVDSKSKFIDKYKVTDASVHDSQALDDLLEEEDKGQDIYADSAYTGEDQEKTINKYGMNNKVHEKGYRNKPLTDEQKANNKEKSRTRARVEHVFGFMEQSMNGLVVKSVGITRATGIIGLINLTYNLFRYEQVMRLTIS
ncbi:MAG: Transposase DDE domain protein [Bacteroidetes bacterium ADurb.Bin013]|jgi:IS5 family transposase|nr:MAG: Transposase DDE domain protein [Bacteroidetes bacterium ADurb.Bin013]